MFDGDKGTEIRTITDGTSKTIPLVEAKREIPWTRAEDMRYQPGKELPEFGGFHDAGFHAVFCDGRCISSVRRRMRASSASCSRKPVANHSHLGSSAIRRTARKRPGGARPKGSPDRRGYSKSARASHGVVEKLRGRMGKPGSIGESVPVSNRAAAVLAWRGQTGAYSVKPFGHSGNVLEASSGRAAADGCCATLRSAPARGLSE